TLAPEPKPRATKVDQSGSDVTPSSDLTRQPRLDETDPCRGFFPRGASSDVAAVTLALVIEPGGEVRSATVLEEMPSGDGFGIAARSCLLVKRFAPGLGPNGRATRAATKVRIRFSR